ncbi:MAG: class I SAM-dependent rRNA methyltransferase [Sphaerospermopsis sp. SIO1G2]|nr:class I SAM-dependent rRNA methyltransferase [Sphaerospermopsis sp. SIO1G2]
MASNLSKPTATLWLKQGKEKLVDKRHPWLFSGAINKVEPTIRAGDLVTICQANGKVRAIAYYNPASQICGRILSWGAETTLPDGFWRQKIEQAYHGRALLQFPDTNTNSYRLIYGESDGVPGLVVDAYDQYLVAQVSTLGIDIRKEAIFQILLSTPLPHSQKRPLAIIERSDAAIRKKEGLPLVNRIAAGTAPPTEIQILENGRLFTVNLTEGHKTGFYLDQRDNRELIGRSQWVADKEILNTFA